MRRLMTTLAVVMFSASAVFGQAVISGRLKTVEHQGSDKVFYMTAIRAFASPSDPNTQPAGFRTFEMEPSGWFMLKGFEDNYTLLFHEPADFMRPLLVTNVFVKNGEKYDRPFAPHQDYANFFHGGWDEKAATDYYQTFTVKGTSITQVGFKLVHDGIDGIGPGAQNVLLSIHKKSDATPDKWEQVGPARRILDVDCGGPKSYRYSAGWNSGEVVTVPGEVYAVHIKPEDPNGKFQAHMRDIDEPEGSVGDCYRIGDLGKTGWMKRQIWMAVSSDCDGLVIPYNKCIHKKYGEFAGGTKKWAQTYVAQGKGLASVILYAAVSGRQPSQNLQKLRVRIHKGGIDGPVVGPQKVAIGNATYTGDASWGTFGLVYAPGEMVLTPGETYAIEFESMETWETLHDYVDIKNHEPDPNPGFNPYKKWVGGEYAQGTAYRNATEKMDFDLDMQVIEYAHHADNWSEAVTGDNLIANGDMEASKDGKAADAWTGFKVDKASTLQYHADGKEKDTKILRVIGGSVNKTTVDGGYVQKVSNLSNWETYRVAGKVRSSWPLEEKHATCVGYDATGQTDDPNAKTIVWTKMPRLNGIWVDYDSDPIRPAKDAISIWLRGWTTQTDGLPFKADFDNFSLRKVDMSVPMH